MSAPTIVGRPVHDRDHGDRASPGRGRFQAARRVTGDDLLARLPRLWMPPEVRAEPVDLGETDALVVRLVGRGSSVHFAKAGLAAGRVAVRHEYLKLRWLFERGAPVSPPVDCVDAPDMFAFRTAALPGCVATRAKISAADLVTCAAGALRRFHATPSIDWPFGSADAARLAEAAESLAGGSRSGRSRAKLARLRAAIPSGGRRPPVVVHGDADLANLVADFPAAAFVDCGGAGLADPYLDLYVMADAIETRLGEEAVEHFFAVYGIATPDEEALAYYRALDDFF